MSTLSFAVKYMRPLPFFLMLAWSVISFSQDKQLDSLREVLLNQAEDTSQVNILNEMAALSYRSAPNESINYSSDARSLAEKLNFRRGLAEAYKNIGLGHYMQGNYTEAYKSWELSLDIFRELGNDQLVSNLLGNLGSIYYTMGKNLEAIDYNIQALKIAEKLGDSTRIGTIMLNIGNVYSEQPATLDNARDYYLQSLEIGESIGYRDLLALGSINLGEVYFKQEKYDSALFFFEKSLLYVDSQIDKAASLGNIGRTYAEK